MQAPATPAGSEAGGAGALGSAHAGGAGGAGRLVRPRQRTVTVVEEPGGFPAWDDTGAAAEKRDPAGPRCRTASPTLTLPTVPPAMLMTWQHELGMSQQDA